MPDDQTLSWLVPALITAALAIGLAIGTAIGWFVRKRQVRIWARIDRREERQVAALQEQLLLLRHLNGDLRHKWEWLAGHEDAQDVKKASPVANEIGTWCYKHSAYFPEKMERTLIGLGHVAFLLATDDRVKWTEFGRHKITTIWESSYMRKYQREVERKLELG